MQLRFVSFCAALIFLGLLWYAIKFTYHTGLYIWDSANCFIVRIRLFRKSKSEVIEDEA